MHKLLLVFLLFFCLSGCGAAAPEIKDTGEPGSIKAFIFLDANHNGVADTGEEGIQASIALSQQLSCPPSDGTKLTKQPAGPDGLTIFKDLKPGKYCLGVYGNYAQTTPIVVQVYLSSNQEAQVAFGLSEKP